MQWIFSESNLEETICSHHSLLHVCTYNTVNIVVSSCEENVSNRYGRNFKWVPRQRKTWINASSVLICWSILFMTNSIDNSWELDNAKPTMFKSGRKSPRLYSLANFKCLMTNQAMFKTQFDHAFMNVFTLTSLCHAELSTAWQREGQKLWITAHTWVHPTVKEKQLGNLLVA